MVKLLSLEELKARGIPFSRQYIRTLIKRGEFPKPVKVGRSRNAWPETEIEAYMRSRVEQRDANA
ncbi:MULTISPECIES: helix-turn-helix transcriptional regulator [Rhizobium]|jgi:prophage regulatory protein|uniref:AlpA family phage regulatory protein n=2 Tax=Rhizobium TaxID=379 RepID=A0ABR6A565_9HYPH|nr:MULTISPECIES: AlpA family phage regulatory protein [Rhizobium]EJB07507.1 putative transcriptional regulator [Rhizobium leguminosarum bv. trifolii WSM597]MBA5801793.1 AlpA family phage regulatory protein [Rhizobium changzhiense]MBY5879847.1 AlpA family phage regulatory protein [Rhizobium leguminosarum]TBF41493.1 AlpA family phage regulatory protein [Rhizobium leguminosarum]